MGCVAGKPDAGAPGVGPCPAEAARVSSGTLLERSPTHAGAAKEGEASLSHDGRKVVIVDQPAAVAQDAGGADETEEMLESVSRGRRRKGTPWARGVEIAAILAQQQAEEEEEEAAEAEAQDVVRPMGFSGLLGDGSPSARAISAETSTAQQMLGEPGIFDLWCNSCRFSTGRIDVNEYHDAEAGPLKKRRGVGFEETLDEPSAAAAAWAAELEAERRQCNRKETPAPWLAEAEALDAADTSGPAAAVVNVSGGEDAAPPPADGAAGAAGKVEGAARCAEPAEAADQCEEVAPRVEIAKAPRRGERKKTPWTKPPANFHMDDDDDDDQ